MGIPEGVFGVIFDYTDHVFFVCPECGTVMIVDDVEHVPESRKLWIHLRCPRCGYRASRKLYYGGLYEPRERLDARIMCIGGDCRYTTVVVTRRWR